MFSWVLENYRVKTQILNLKFSWSRPMILKVTACYFFPRLPISRLRGSQKLESDLGQPAAAEIIHIHEYE